MDQDLKQLIEGLDKKIDERFDGVDKKFEKVDERFDGVDKKFEKVTERFNSVDKKIDENFRITQENVDSQFERAFEVFATKEDVKNLEEKVDGLREMMQVLVMSVDKIVKELSDLRTEYYAMSNQLTRHEKWIQALAEKVGIKLAF